jgi:hypothetical protein
MDLIVANGEGEVRMPRRGPYEESLFLQPFGKNLSAMT